MESVAEIKNNMAHAIGTERYIKHNTGLLVFTDGVDQVRQDAEIFWLVDAIAFHQAKHGDKKFQVWELTVNKDHSAVLTMKEDTGKPVIVRQKIFHTNFPLEYIKFYVIKGGYGTEDNWTTCPVLMLPSEY